MRVRVVRVRVVRVRVSTVARLRRQKQVLMGVERGGRWCTGRRDMIVDNTGIVLIVY